MFKHFQPLAAALWEASSRLRNADHFPLPQASLTLQLPSSTCAPHFSPARALQLPGHLLRQETFAISEPNKRTGVLKAPCEPSAGDVGEEITLVFNNMLLKYLDFFSWYDLLRRQDVCNYTIYFLVLLCSDD